ncbi:hypothetical protein E4P82_20860 [Candidatus Competibacter phosphatis]|uniref:Uncharacterized protein n=1 Tax=Candidatus Competibacter phosphatis TaxID=221280 RepID=A0ABX1TSV8_9GAMM|nr:hypothetical protein [Candidatus Competibacter phosphatis]NMQ21440.1 hypothetical protein [Candidatus Competibacter phosphatis]
MSKERFDFMMEAVEALTELLDDGDVRGLGRKGRQAILERIRALRPEEFLSAPAGGAQIIRFPTTRRINATRCAPGHEV